MRDLDFRNAVWQKQPSFIKKLGDTSNMYRLFSAIFDSIKENYLDETKREKSFAFLARQLFIDTAEGIFLDEHAKRLSIKRYHGEEDISFRSRLKKKSLLSYKTPSIDTIKDYIKDVTGYSIEIYDHSSLGYINPLEYEEPGQFTLSKADSIYNIKYIHFHYDPNKKEYMLHNSLDDIISPFVSYYTKRLVDNGIIEREIQQFFGGEVSLEIDIQGRKVSITVKDILSQDIDVNYIETKLEELFDINGGYAFHITWDNLSTMLGYFAGENSYDVADDIVTLKNFPIIDTPILGEKINKTFDANYTVQDPFHALSSELDIDIIWGSSLMFSIDSLSPQNIMTSSLAHDYIYVHRNTAADVDTILERLEELNKDKKYIIY